MSETRYLIRSLSVDTYPYFAEWIEVPGLINAGFIGNYERKEAPENWEGLKLEESGKWATTELDKCSAETLIAAVTEELNTSDLNVCHTGDLKEETDATAVALAITSLRTLFPGTSEFHGPKSGVLRVLMSKEKFTDLSEDMPKNEGLECSGCMKKDVTVKRHMFDGLCGSCTNKALYDSEFAEQASAYNKRLIEKAER